MASRMLMHLDGSLRSFSEGLACCGMQIPDSHRTLNEAEATCRSCLYVMNPTPRPQTRKAYSDPQFVGTGFLKCALCGTAIREHPGWPCSLRNDFLR